MKVYTFSPGYFKVQKGRPPDLLRDVVLFVFQRLHIHYHYGIRVLKPELGWSFGTRFHNGSIYGASGFLVGFIVLL